MAQKFSEEQLSQLREEINSPEMSEKMAMSGYTPYKRRKVVAPSGGKSRVQQQFREEQNINAIVKKYNVRRFMERPGDPDSVGAVIIRDYSNMPSFHEMQNYIAHAKETFNRLPSNIRSRFDNDPQELISFVQDPKNRQEGEFLGIFRKDDPEPPKEDFTVEEKKAIARFLLKNEQDNAAKNAPPAQ